MELTKQQMEVVIFALDREIDLERMSEEDIVDFAKKEQEKFNQASEQIFRYHDLAYGRIALAKFMEAIEEYPQLPLKDIYDLMYEEDEDEEED